MSLFKGLFDEAPEDTGRTMVLRLLTLRNFKKFTEYVLEPNGEDLFVYGDNETGKSTLMDACMWLLFDKDSLNRKDFEIKRLNENNEPAHHLEHEVEGAFTVERRTLTLKKVFKEKWTKKRGAPTESFEGHETLYFIDGVPSSKSEYDKRVASIMDEEAFRLLTDPRYFNEVLHWTKRRALLLQVCGDVSDADVIASDDKLAGLTEILGDRSLEDLRKVILSQKTRINKELQEIPIRISEANRNLPDVSGMTAERIRSEIDRIRPLRDGKAAELLRAEQGGAGADLIVRLTKAENTMADMEAEARRQLEDVAAKKRRELLQADFEYKQAEQTWKNLDLLSQAKAQEAEAEDAKLDALRDEWGVIDAEEFACSEATVCPTCGQDLPDEQIEKARRKAEEAFNLSKSKRFEENEKQGKGSVQRKKALEAESAKYHAEADAYQKKMDDLLSTATKLKAELSALPLTVNLTTPEYNKLAMERERLTALIASASEDGTQVIKPLQEAIATYNEELSALAIQAANMAARKQGEERIAELNAREKTLASEFEKLEQALYLTEEFMRVKVKMLEDRIASKFRMCRFKMFDQQVNGALAECCETLVKGVPYSKGLNNGGKIQAGIDIINALQKHYGFVAPIWLDNRESVSWIPETKAQVISLIVSPQDKVLRVEKEAS